MDIREIIMQMQAVGQACITFPFSNWSLGKGPGFTLQWKTTELGFSVTTYPGLEKSRLAIVRSVLTHRNGNSRYPHYEQSFIVLPAGTTDSQALDEAIRLNEEQGKPSNIVHFVVRGTGNDMASAVGQWGAAHPYKMAA